MRVGLRAVGVHEARYCAIVIELDPLSRTGESVAAWDVEVGNAIVIEGVPLRSPLEGLLVLEDAVLKTLDLFGEPVELHGSIGFTVGDGGEKTVRNRAKEDRVDVIVGSER